MKIVRDIVMTSRGTFTCSHCGNEIEKNSDYRHIIYETRDAIKIWRACPDCYEEPIRGLTYAKPQKNSGSNSSYSL